ncbi:MAG: hypothetical protein AAF533_01310 [Acidobacteriota bacterium]
MSEYLQVLLAFPTVVFTVLLGIALCYWLMVILGAMDIDSFDPFHHLDGAVDGALNAADGAAEAAGKAAGEVVGHAVEGAAEAAGKAAGEAAGEAAGKAAGEASSGGALGLMTTLGLKGIPCSVTGTVVVMLAWAACAMAMQALTGRLPGGWVFTALATAISLAALMLGVLGAAVLLQPLRPVFQTKGARSVSAFVGKTCTVTTGEVTETFGQAELFDDEEALLVQVRSDPSNELKKGSTALIYDHDPKREVFLVVPHEED